MGICGSYARVSLSTWGQDSRHSQVSEMRSESQVWSARGDGQRQCLSHVSAERTTLDTSGTHAVDVETKTQRPDQSSSSSPRMEQPLAKADALAWGGSPSTEQPLGRGSVLSRIRDQTHISWIDRWLFLPVCLQGSSSTNFWEVNVINLAWY